MLRSRLRLGPLAAWIAVAAALVPLQRQIDASITTAGSVTGTESAEASRRLETDFTSPFAQPALLVISGLSHAADSDSGRAFMRTLVAPFLESRAVVAMLSPGASLDTLLVGANKTTAIAIVGLAPTVRGALDTVRAIASAHLAEFRRAEPQIALRWTGQPALVQDLRTFGPVEARRAESRALPVTVIVAVIAFGSFADAGIAVVAAVLAILVALGVTGALSLVVPAGSFTRTLVPLIGLALTVDYALLVVRRTRAGSDIRDARRTVLLAAGVVALGFAGLALAPTGDLRSAALAGIVTCAIAAFAAATLTPAASPASAVRSSSDRWRRWGAFVTRRPLLVLIVAGIPLGLLANAARTARLVTPLEQLLPTGMESADAYRDLQTADRTTAAAALRVLVELPRGTTVMSAEGWAAVKTAVQTLKSVPGAAEARSITSIGNGELGVASYLFPRFLIDTYVSRDGRTAIIDVFPDRAHAGARATELVQTVRALDASRASGVASTRLFVAGLPAYALDYQTAVSSALPWIIAATSLATFIALLSAFRAPLVAFKAVALNLFVAAAAIGATVLVFQDGYGASLIGHQGLGSIFPTVPALAFGAAFGTSMDYEIFLLASVRDARRSGMTNTDAIVDGLARSGGLITRAALVMACLFLAFATSDLLPLAMTGFALAVAVIVDATLVRLALAPAILQIAGRWNWWPNR